MAKLFCGSRTVQPWAQAPAQAHALCAACSKQAGGLPAAHLVGDQDGGLVGKHVLDAVLEDVLGGVVVHGGQGVVKQHQVAVEVGAAGQVQALALAARQVDAAQASLQ